MRYIFHLSIPVSNLEQARKFYEEVLHADTGRTEKDWLDILLWGHQITLQHCPEGVLSNTEQGKRHFGFVLPWKQWETIAERLQFLETGLLEAPKILKENTPDEQAKIFLQDPDGNIIEIKTYRNVSHVLGLTNEGYD